MSTTTIATTAAPTGDGWTFEGLADAEADLPLRLSRYEVVDSALVVRPEMTVVHDVVAEAMARWLGPFAPVGWTTRHELAVTLGRDGRRADFGVVRAEVAVRRRQMGHLPADILLLGEVVSQSSRKTDRLFKPAEYAEAGVGAYWRVELDPEPLLVVHALVGTTYEVVQQLTGTGRVTVPFEVELDLPALLPPLLD